MNEVLPSGRDVLAPGNVAEPRRAVLAGVRALSLLRANLAVTRMYTVLPLALLAYGIGVHSGAGLARAATVATAIACAVGGGNAYNDLRDQTCDRYNRPRRPIVSGRLSERYVRRLVHVLFGGALLLALTTSSWRTVLFVVLLIASSLLYSDSIKRIPGLKNAFVGLWCAVLPWGAALDVVDAEMVLPAIATVALFVTQKELFADVYDLEGDVAAGVRTIPAIAGPRGAIAIVALLNVASFLLVRISDGSPAIPGLRAAAALVACVNVAGLLIVAARLTPVRVHAFLEVQKVFLIGGCVALFALLAL